MGAFHIFKIVLMEPNSAKCLIFIFNVLLCILLNSTILDLLKKYKFFSYTKYLTKPWTDTTFFKELSICCRQNLNSCDRELHTRLLGIAIVVAGHGNVLNTALTTCTLCIFVFSCCLRI